MASPAPTTISYKKKRPVLPQPPSAAASPRLDINASSPLPGSAPGTPTTGTRKVSSRRKALQEFYKLRADGASAASSKEQLHGLGLSEPSAEPPQPEETPAQATPEDDAALIEKLQDEHEMQAFIKRASIEEILRVRNAAASRINHHDSEKKSIIYNNYSELIRLNQILSEVNNAAEDTDVYSEHKPRASPQAIEACLNELSSFVDTEAVIFNQDFTSVVRDLCGDMSGSESLASMTGLAD